MSLPPRQHVVYFVVMRWKRPSDEEHNWYPPTPWVDYESALKQFRDEVHLFTQGWVETAGKREGAIRAAVEKWAKKDAPGDDVQCEIIEAPICVKSRTGWKTLDLHLADEKLRAERVPGHE